MDRELLIEIGVEELPAEWLPALTRQMAEKLDTRLAAMRLTPDVKVETIDFVSAETEVSPFVLAMTRES